MTTNQTLKNWVDEVSQLTQADNIYWCNGSDQEFDAMANRLESEGGFSRLNPDTHPNCWLHRSDPSDVARVEHCTFVCTSEQDDAGPNNNWMAPELARARMEELLRGCMKGRTPSSSRISKTVLSSATRPTASEWPRTKIFPRSINKWEIF